jgi:shikimate kinase
MGTGKSRVGKELSIRLGRTFIETDDLIVERTGKSITEIFKQDGEKVFRRLEREIIEDMSVRRNAVISCGGGIVLNASNVENLRRSSVLFLLTASSEVILDRITKDGESRPLLNVQDRMKKIKSLMEFRQPFYIKAADHVINTTDLEIDQVVDNILEFFKKRCTL